MAFEHGFSQNHVNELFLVVKMKYLPFLKRFKQELVEAKNYEDITFDVVKRGPLSLFAFGLFIAILSFVFELLLLFVIYHIS